MDEYCRHDSSAPAEQIDIALRAPTGLQRLLDGLPLGVLVVGEDLTVRYLNAHSETHLGISRGAAIGRLLHDAVPAVRGSWFEDFHRDVVDRRAEVTVRAASLLLSGRTFEVTGCWVGGDVAIMFRDVTDAQDTVTRLLEAYHSILDRSRRDELTGVLTRAALLERLTDPHTTAAAVGAVLFVDVDDFKAVNDSHGHRAGDHVLATLADRLATECGPADVLGRIGGDEFVIGIARAGHRRIGERADDLSVRLRRRAAEPIRTPDAIVRVTISVGVAVDAGGASLADLLGRADTDLYRVKRRGDTSTPRSDRSTLRSVARPRRTDPSRWTQPHLTAREVEVLLAWFRTESKTATARSLHLALGTINTHLSRIRRKYADVGRPAPTKAALVARALQDGLIDITDI